jgi:hypothetical protein
VRAGGRAGGRAGVCVILCEHPIVQQVELNIFIETIYFLFAIFREKALNYIYVEEHKNDRGKNHSFK